MAACERTSFAHFMEQGTGKTYVALAEAEHLWNADKITALVVIAPNGVHRNWLTEEVPKFLSIPHRTLTWRATDSKAFATELSSFTRHPPSEECLLILAFNVEAFSMKGSKAETFLRVFMRAQPTLLVLDESSTIKNPTAQRTKHLLKLSKEAPFRRILTGTPVTQSPFNLYAQFKFLGDELLGFSNFSAFKAHYGLWRERVLNQPNGAPAKRFQELVRYRRLDDLRLRVAPHSFRVTKAEAAPHLPDKTYLRRPVTLTPSQRKLYTLAKRSALDAIECTDGTLTLTHALTRMTRLAQICGGFVQWDEAQAPAPIEGPNPKLMALEALLEDLPEDVKVVIWARYVPELKAIHEMLGAPAVLFTGEVASNDRMDALEHFRKSTAVRYLVANPKIGKWGFTLTEASHVIYFSNDFSAESRWQSEDRVHRIGQSLPVTIHDIVAADTLDERILSELRDRRDVADLFTRPPDSGLRAKLRALLAEGDDE
jgi:SNF2 family DNA or RNA helicase